MNKQQALEFITQALNDFLATMPASCKGPFSQVAQQAIKTLEQQDAQPVKDPEP